MAEIEKDDHTVSMVMRKQHALEILRGEKVREYRAFSDHWAKRFCVCEDPNDPFLITGWKQIEAIHFYPYNNKWHLDVKVNDISYVEVTEEWAEQYAEEIDAPVGSSLFVIDLGEVISTNLIP